MQLHVIGPDPFACDPQGIQLTRIGTLFPDHGTLYTKGPGVHAWQRFSFIEHLNVHRAAKGLPPMSVQEEESVCANSVDLVFESKYLLIRPDPDHIGLALRADELLQTLVPKRQIRFLSVRDTRVREALRSRGEYWRLSSIPKTKQGKERLLIGSKVLINGLPIYYYNRLTGTRWLTYTEFERLGQMAPSIIALHLQEIADYSNRHNRLGRPELDFFGADLSKFGGSDFARGKYHELTPLELQTQFESLRVLFRNAVDPSCVRDDFGNRTWCERLLSTLFLEGNEAQTEDVLSGLGPEFFLQVEWLPGGRIEEGEFLLDPVFDEAASHTDDADLQRLCDPRAKEIILNFTRDYGDLDYINLGCVPESLSLDRPQKEGRRGVYLVEFHPRNAPEPIRRFLRLQKWGVWEHLDEGKNLLEAILESDEYTDYLLDRRLGCRQLGMNLCRRSMMRRLTETYLGINPRYRGQTIRTTYFEREYLCGIATDKLPVERYLRPGYAARLAELLGQAAASGMVVGRSLEHGRPTFDDGDEVVLEGPDGLPEQIMVADHSGAFTEFKQPLIELAADYARPVNRRSAMVPNPVEFARIFLESFKAQLAHVQRDYRKRRRAFEHLFKHRRYDPGGSFAFRWECVLRRLDQSDMEAITNAVRQQIEVLNRA